MILQRPHIALIGWPTSGKSTLGKHLANALKRPWFDSDQCFEVATGEKIADLFARGEEPRFRRWERHWLEELPNLPAAVLSTGGGLPCQPGALDLLKQSALTLYLQVDWKTILARLQACQHALLRSRSPIELETLLMARLPIYAQADLTLQAQGKTPEALLEELLNHPALQAYL